MKMKRGAADAENFTNMKSLNTMIDIYFDEIKCVNKLFKVTKFNASTGGFIKAFISCSHRHSLEKAFL